MNGYTKLIDNVPKGIAITGKEVDEDKRLELRLGPPSDASHCTKRGFHDTFERKSGHSGNWLVSSKAKVAELECREKQPFCDTPNTDLSISSHKRNGLPPVVGWPPVRSFRKNIVTNNNFSKPPSQSVTKFSKDENSEKTKDMGSGLFVKINMDGIPIGRKVDLKAYDNYQNLSTAVDELFRGLLAAQGEENGKKKGEEIKGLLDGNGEYTLVYEDSEGDRILVGDVPWSMFISSAKRLRVLKRSELHALRQGNK